MVPPCVDGAAQGARWRIRNRCRESDPLVFGGVRSIQAGPLGLRGQVDDDIGNIVAWRQAEERDIDSKCRDHRDVGSRLLAAL